MTHHTPQGNEKGWQGTLIQLSGDPKSNWVNVTV